jgi:hypothetical protein
MKSRDATSQRRWPQGLRIEPLFMVVIAISLPEQPTMSSTRSARSSGVNSLFHASLTILSREETTLVAEAIV